MSTLSSFAVALSLAAVAACGSKEETKKAAPAAAKPASAPAPAVAPAPAPAPAAAPAPAPGGDVAWTAVPAGKFQLQAGSGATASDSSSGDNLDVRIEVGDHAISLRSTADYMKRTFEQATDMTGVNLTAKASLADGWHRQITASSGEVEVAVQRTVGGKTVDCGGVGADAASATLIANACLSLKPL